MAKTDFKACLLAKFIALTFVLPNQSMAEVKSISPNWDGFNYEGTTQFLSLDEAQERAVLNKIDVETSKIVVDTAKSNIEKSEASFDPQFEVTTTKSRSADKPTSSIGNKNEIKVGVSKKLEIGTILSATQTYTQTDAVSSGIELDGNGDTTSISITQPLLKNSGKLVNTLGREKAEISLSIQEIIQLETALGRYQEATVAFWNHWRSSQSLQIAIEQYELAKKQEALSEKLSDAGLVAKLEVLRAQTGVAQRFETVLAAQANVIKTNTALLLHLDQNIPSNDNILVKASAGSPYPPINLKRSDMLDMAVKNSLTLKRLNFELSSSSLDVDVTSWQKNPNLDLNMSYSHSDEIFKNQTIRSETTNSNNWSVGLSLSIPFGQRESRENFRQAINAQTLARTSITKEQQNIVRAATSTADSLYQNYRRLLAAEAEVGIAEKIYDAELKQFNRGEQTSTEVLNAAAQIAAAQNKMAFARAEYEKSKADMDIRIGKASRFVQGLLGLK